MAYTIRRATEKDCNTVLKIVKACDKDLTKKGIGMWNGQSRKSVMKNITTKEMFIMYDNRTAIGTISITAEVMRTNKYVNITGLFRNLKAKAFTLGTLAVLPRRQGEGIGTKLLDFAENEARLRSVKYLRLCAFADYPQLLRFYKKRGYRLCGMRKVSWWKDTKGAFFEKTLA